MKLKAITLALASIVLAGSAQAQTYIEITGATAFRTAAVNSIQATFAASGNSYSVTYQSTDSSGASKTLTNSTLQMWRGTLAAPIGSCVIRTSWNGSVEGVRAVAEPGASTNPSYFLVTEGDDPAVVVTTNPTAKAVTFPNSDTEAAVSDMSFSDVAQAATPVTATTLAGGPVGVVVFTMIANKTWADDGLLTAANTKADGITAQQFRLLAGSGKAPLSFFTGNAADTKKVYLTGRNDGSGTRTTYLAETGFGISNPVIQYVVHDRTTANIEKILKTAKGGGFNFQNAATQGITGYASTVWGNDQDGNGGYSSGSNLANDLKKTSASTAVWEFFDADDSGDYQASEDFEATAADKVYLVTWLSYSDAYSARGNAASPTVNAAILKYNGVRLGDLYTDPSNDGLISSADRALVAQGVYTAWGYEQLLHLGNAATNSFFTTLKTALNSASVVGTAGMALNEMNVNRLSDGGTLFPGAL